MADKTDSAGFPSATPIPAMLAPGLDLFAAAWLQQWTDAGGGVQLEKNGKAGFWRPEYWLSPEFVEPPEGLPDWMRDEQAHFRQHLYTGKMLALLDLLETVPCGAAAVKAHMRAHGIQSYFGKPGSLS